MRITNGMMINNTLSNINMNKLNVDKYSTQQATGKKIQKPSDDPIIAVRALRFRSQLAELEQYLKKNIPDAESWLDVTEEALSGASDMLSSMQKYMEQGATDSLDTTNRQSVLTTLKQYREQIFENANADFAGRRVFSGYKTDTDMTFEKDDKEAKYTITEELTSDDFDMISKVLGKVDVAALDVKNMTALEPTDMANDKTDIYRLRLSYDGLTGTGAAADLPELAVRNADGTTTPVAGVKVIYANVDGDYVYDDGTGTEVKVDPYNPGEDDIYILSESGEVVFGEKAYQKYRSSDLTVTYTKEGFVKGDLRPEHYFDCTCYRKDATGTYQVNTKYEEKQQDINYTVNFNQTLKVNTEGKNVFTHDIVRDLDDLIAAVEDLDVIEANIAKVKKMKEEAIYSDDESQKKLDSVIEALEKEQALQEDVVQKLFEKSMTLFSEHQKVVDAEIADVGSRDARLSLNKKRLTDQQTSVEDLKSVNEDIDLPETIINLTTASTVYEASLSAAGKVISTSLLDYLQ